MAVDIEFTFDAASEPFAYQPSELNYSGPEPSIDQLVTGANALNDRSEGAVVRVTWGDRGIPDGLVAALIAARNDTDAHSISWRRIDGTLVGLDVWWPSEVPYRLSAPAVGYGSLSITFYERPS